MKKHLLLIFLGVAALLCGCGGGSQSVEGGGASSKGSRKATTVGEGEQSGNGGTPKQKQKAERPMVVAMDGWDGAETSSILEAEYRGFFEKANLSVLTLSPATPMLTIPDVVRGQDSLGVAHGPEAVAAVDKGVPITIVGNVLQQATAAFIWKKGSGILGIADLQGKTIAVPGLSFQYSFLQNVLSEGGLSLADVKVVSVGNDLVPALLNGRADAIFGGSGNVEGVDLESKGYQPVVTPVTDLGIPDYDELVLVARRDIAEAEPEPIEDFVKATARGAYEATDKPGEASEALIASGESNPEISPAAMRIQVGATVGKLSDSGYVDPARFQRLIDWMYENEMISEAYSVRKLLPDS